MTTQAARSPAVWAFAEHEHLDLVRGINRLHEVGCEVGRCSTLELSVDVLSIVAWLDATLAPHIAWEESWLYPVIDRRLGTPWATRAARFDHQQIRVIAAQLRVDHGQLTRREPGDPQIETRCHLFSLEALLRAHVEREERFLIPILDDDETSYAAESGARTFEALR